MQLPPHQEDDPSPTQIFRQSLKLDPLVPPLRFTLLSLSFRDLTNRDRSISSNSNDEDNTPLPRLYSSSHPLPRHLPFLQRLQLKTIVALTPKDPIKQVPAIQPWAQANGVAVKWMKVGSWKDDGVQSISKDVAQEAISTLIPASAHPTLLVTLTTQPASMILALLRLVQGYSLTSIHSEIHRALRTGMEADADEDDRQDIENWIKSWVGKECSLSLRRSQLQEWVWPEETILSGIRKPSPSQPQVVHPFLKLFFLPEQIEHHTPTIHIPHHTRSTPLPEPLRTAPLPAPIRMGRKRSQTISEGRNDTLAHLMADTAATAAIQTCGIDIGGDQGPSTVLSIGEYPKRQTAPELSIFSRSLPSASLWQEPLTPTYPSVKRPPMPPPPPPYLDEGDQYDGDDGEAEEDDSADQSTPKAQARSSYITMDRRNSSGDGRKPSAATQARTAAGLSPAFPSSPDGDETPTKAKLQSQQHARIVRRKDDDDGAIGDSLLRADEDDDPNDDSFSHTAAHTRGRSRGDSNVTLRVPVLGGEPDEKQQPSSSSPPSSPEQASSEPDEVTIDAAKMNQLTRLGAGRRSRSDSIGDTQQRQQGEEEEEEDDEDDDDDDDEEERPQDEEDFSARLEALDLA